MLTQEQIKEKFYYEMTKKAALFIDLDRAEFEKIFGSYKCAGAFDQQKVYQAYLEITETKKGLTLL